MSTYPTKNILSLVLILGLIGSCTTHQDTLFQLKDPVEIGMPFSNDLSFDNDFNVYKYRNYYNGGGVSLGDINNDGLLDVYLTANQLPNKLFLNKGNFTFEDITDKAGVAGTKAWSTGVTMVDINADGLLDIYVCNSGDVQGDNKQNELFINNGDLTFTEQATAYGLDDRGFSTHATFFDYDKDGDLDAYLLNNSYQAIGSFDLRRNERPKRDAAGGDKLMQNNNGVFVDVSEQAGIYGSVIGFGLGVSVGDLNNDGWEDIFVSNDFFERDYLYINQKDGTFKEDLVNQMHSISGASMGADMADINNDGHNDLFVTEMLPSDYQRLKTVTTFEDWNKYQYVVNNGYHHQFTRNMLHLNNGDTTFSEIGRWAGVEASDWSWGALFFDMDNDGYKDLFIANGIYQDLTDQDYLQYVASDEVIKSIVQNNEVDYKRLIDIIPSNKVPNHAYRNTGGIGFEDFKGSGLQLDSFSNGAAYGDLDNDGDLDLIVNNVNMPLFVFQNTATQNGNNYLKISLKGTAQNPHALGAKIQVKTASNTLLHEVQPVRGFQSSMDLVATVGVGKATAVDIKIIFPSGKQLQVENVSTNAAYTFSEKDALIVEPESLVPPTYFYPLTDTNFPEQQENTFVDFHRERLNYHMLSTQGPKIKLADLDADGQKEMIFPAAKGYPSQILKQTAKGWIVDTKNIPLFDALKEIEHIETAVFDAENDGDLDLLIISGGVETTIYSSYLKDLLLLNDGKGGFSQAPEALPETLNQLSTQAVAVADINGDGFLDLFIGERSVIGAYGQLGSGFVLINDGQGVFEDQTQRWAPELQEAGLFTSAVFYDFDEDGDPDLLATGEFMGLQIYRNDNNRFVYLKEHPLATQKGWWNNLAMVDVNRDGREDLVAGNHGENSRFKASPETPIRCYYNDFDDNGKGEGVMTFTTPNQEEYPYALRHNLISQMKSLKKKFPNFDTFKNAQIQDILPIQKLQSSVVCEVNELKTKLFINQGDFKFVEQPLPEAVQFSPVYAIAALDYDKDGDQDLLLGGNLYEVKPEVGIYDASYGTVLENTPNGFRYHKDGLGFKSQGQTRSIVVDGDQIWVGRNKDRVLGFTLKNDHE
ncbi:MAG: VCBS repeat-containing protein [Flavobacteriaceae bacterium]